MKVKVLYFAFLRDAMGRTSDEVEAPDSVATVGALREHLTSLGGPWARAFASVKRIRASVNQQMASDSDPVKDGDEVAFFPPVTGG